MEVVQIVDDCNERATPLDQIHGPRAAFTAQLSATMTHESAEADVSGP